jgi:hypothetical protein
VATPDFRRSKPADAGCATGFAGRIGDNSLEQIPAARIVDGQMDALKFVQKITAGTLAPDRRTAIV